MCHGDTFLRCVHKQENSVIMMCLNVSSPGDPDSGPKAEPGFRPRGPGLEEPAAGEGEDAALTGGKQSVKPWSIKMLR